MKKLQILIIVLFILSGAKGQNCLPGGIKFSTQAQIDNFQNNYPGCTHIEGEVIITGTDISKLDGLSALRSIGESLLIYENYSLKSLAGLDNLSHIGKGLYIEYTSLDSLAGLDNLVFIGGELKIHFNQSLSSLKGLDKVDSIGGDIMVSVNNSLASLEGLEGLHSVKGDLTIRNNDSLVSLVALKRLHAIGGYLQVSHNHSLASLAGLDNINAGSVTDVIIMGNSSLSTCKVKSLCDLLASPDSNIEIHENAAGCNSQVEVKAGCDR